MANWRLTSITGHEPRTFSWDARGNLSASAGRTYDFDHGNRLRAVNGVESYVYDGHGRRVVATDSASGLPIISMFSQAGTLLYQWNLRLNRQIEYIHLGSRLVAQREQPIGGGAVNVKYLHTDVLGTPVLETGSTGAQVQTAEYDPWGRLLNHPVTDKVGFTGHLQDGSTGLTYMQQRYYDPTIGRFISSDPDPVDRRRAWNFNRYAYARNSPYRFTDPDGRRARLSDEKKRPPPEPEPDRSDAATMATVAVTAVLPRTVSAPSAIPWGRVAGGAGHLIRPWPLLIFLPSELGAPACEMPDGPPCGMYNEQPDERDLTKLKERDGNKAAEEAGYIDAHDAKKGRGEGGVDIYRDREGRRWLWSGVPGAEKEEL